MRAGAERDAPATPFPALPGGETLRCLALACAMVFASPATRAQEPPFKGKTVTVNIGYSTGGNYDFIGRLVARHIGKHLPGNPAGVAVNMPGAGSIRAGNYLFHTAPRDGTALGVLSSSVAIEEALGTPGIQYKSAEFTWIGRVSMILQVLATVDPSKTRRIADALVHDTPMSGTGAGSPSEGYPKLLNGVLGTKFRIISGYTSSADSLLAMERGEVDGALPSWNTIKRTKQDWLREGRIHPLVQFVFERSPDLPDTPTSIELGRTPEERDILAFYTSGEEIGRSIMAPPGIAPDRVAMLRKAFENMLKDEEFLDEVRRTQVEFNPLSGEKLREIVERTVRASPATVNRTRVLLGIQ